MADPARTFTRVFEHLRPGGLIAVTEMAFFPLFLPEDIGIGRPGLEAACTPPRTPGRPTNGPVS